MKFKYLFSALLLLTNLIAVPSALAGGAVFIPYADTNGWVVSPENSNPGYGRFIRAYLNPKQITCQGSEITFKFNDSKDGDWIMTASGNSTIKLDNTCETWAKMSSKEPGERQVDINIKDNTSWSFKVDFDGQYHPDNVQDGYLYRTASTNPYIDNGSTAANPTPTPYPAANIDAFILNQQIIDNSNRQVTVKWGAFGGYPGTFTIYTKLTNKKDWGESFDGSKGPSAKITLRSDEDYYIKVYGCQDKIGTCADSNTIMLPKVISYNPKPTSYPTTVNSQNPAPTIVYVNNGNDQKVNDLNKKVGDLQNQLDQSKKKQSSLEQRINDLLTFLKRIFPFFK